MTVDRLQNGSPRPTVSVICTARNAEATIQPVLESIVRQSFPNWELVVVDDGSTDGTLNILREYAKNDPRIRVIASPGVGRGKALNLAIGHCRSSLIANIDADDPSHFQRLEFQLKALKEHPEFTLICSDTVHLFDDDVLAQTTLEYQATATTDITRELALRNPINHSATLIRKVALDHLGGYSEKRRSLFDYELWIRLAEAGYKLGKLNCPLASKRIHSGQSFETKKRLAYLYGVSKLQSRAIRALGSHWSAWGVMVLKFVWGLLPQRLRIVSRQAAVLRLLPS